MARGQFRPRQFQHQPRLSGPGLQRRLQRGDGGPGLAHVHQQPGPARDQRQVIRAGLHPGLGQGAGAVRVAGGLGDVDPAQPGPGLARVLLQHPGIDGFRPRKIAGAAHQPGLEQRQLQVPRRPGAQRRQPVQRLGQPPLGIQRADALDLQRPGLRAGQKWCRRLDQLQRPTPLPPRQGDLDPGQPGTGMIRAQVQHPAVHGKGPVQVAGPVAHPRQRGRQRHVTGRRLRQVFEQGQRLGAGAARLQRAGLLGHDRNPVARALRQSRLAELARPPRLAPAQGDLDPRQPGPGMIRAQLQHLRVKPRGLRRLSRLLGGLRLGHQAGDRHGPGGVRVRHGVPLCPLNSPAQLWGGRPRL